MSDGVLANAIEAIGFVREGTIGEASNIPVESWDFRPHPDAKSASELVRHIIEASLMLIGEAADPDGDFTRRSPQDHVLDHAGHLPQAMTPSQLLAALESSLETCKERIRAAGEDHLVSRHQAVRRGDMETRDMELPRLSGHPIS